MSSSRRSPAIQLDHPADRKCARYGHASKHAFDARFNDDVKSSEPQGVTAGASNPIQCRNRRSICLPFLLRSLIDQEIVQISAASKLRPQPSRLPAATRPCLRWVLRIAIFGTDGRIWTAALMIEPCELVGQSNPAEPFLQMCFLRQYFLREFGGDLLMKYPELVNGERTEMRGVHDSIRILGRRPRQTSRESGSRQAVS